MPRRRNNCCFEIRSTEEIVNQNCVKVVTTEDDQALYFSRAIIPFDRDASISPAKAKESSYLKHIGIYSFYAGSLKEYVANGECKLEKLEKLEQLRWLWMGKNKSFTRRFFRFYRNRYTRGFKKS